MSGAFLTGDLFNMFVFFEVLLMASYGLIVLGGDKVQLRESIKYVFINLFSSMLFVTAVAFIYGAVGTVNMAQIAQRVQEVDQQGILTTVAHPSVLFCGQSSFVPIILLDAEFICCSKPGYFGTVRSFADEGWNLFDYPCLFLDFRT